MVTITEQAKNRIQKIKEGDGKADAFLYTRG